MRTRSVVRAVAVVAIVAATQAAWTSGEAEASRTLSTGVIVSGKISPGPWVVDDVHGRVFVATVAGRLISFSLALSDRHGIPMGTGDVRLFMSPKDTDVFVMKRTLTGWQLHRFDPASLARTGTWSEPRVAAPLNVVWSRGLFWTVLDRGSATRARYVLASLDPTHPGLGWRTRLDTDCGFAAYMVSSPAGHWIACAASNNFADVYLYHIGRDRVPTLTNLSEGIEYLISGPSFSPDGATAVMDSPTQVPDHVVDGFYLANTTDLATPTSRWVTPDNYRFASFTPDGRWIAAVDGVGSSFFFDPTDPAAPPIAGASIPYDSPGEYGIHGVANPGFWPAFTTEHPYLYDDVLLNLSGPSGGGPWTWHLTRYPIPSP